MTSGCNQLLRMQMTILFQGKQSGSVPSSLVSSSLEEASEWQKERCQNYFRLLKFCSRGRQTFVVPCLSWKNSLSRVTGYKVGDWGQNLDRGMTTLLETRPPRLH